MGFFFFNQPPEFSYPSEWWPSEWHPWEDIHWFQGHEHWSNVPTLLQSSLSELPPKLTLKSHRRICLLTRETQLISKSKTFTAERDHPPYSPVWALMTFSCLFKYSLFSEDKDLSPLRRFKGLCDRLWMQFDNRVASSSPTSSIWFAFSKCHGKQATRNQEVLFWIRKQNLGFSFGGTVVKNLPDNAGDKGSSPAPGRSHKLRSN